MSSGQLRPATFWGLEFSGISTAMGGCYFT
jgi:hypothetical protein